MPRPSFRSQANTSGQATITLNMPTHATNDIIIVAVQTANEALTANTTNYLAAQGFSAAPNGTITGIGTAAAAGGTRLFVYYTRATTAAQSAVVIDDTGNHQVLGIAVFQNANTSGDPFNISANQRITGATTTISFPSLTTTVANTLAVFIMGSDADNATGQLGALTNANLTGIAEHTDLSVTTQAGGGIAIASGANTGSGALGNTTATKTTSSVFTTWMGVLKGTPDAVIRPKTQVIFI